MKLRAPSPSSPNRPRFDLARNLPRSAWVSCLLLASCASPSSDVETNENELAEVQQELTAKAAVSGAVHLVGFVSSIVGLGSDLGLGSEPPGPSLEEIRGAMREELAAMQLDLEQNIASMLQAGEARNRVERALLLLEDARTPALDGTPGYRRPTPQHPTQEAAYQDFMQRMAASLSELRGMESGHLRSHAVLSARVYVSLATVYLVALADPPGDETPCVGTACADAARAMEEHIVRLMGHDDRARVVGPVTNQDWWWDPEAPWYLPRYFCRTSFVDYNGVEQSYVGPPRSAATPLHECWATAQDGGAALRSQELKRGTSLRSTWRRERFGQAIEELLEQLRVVQYPHSVNAALGRPTSQTSTAWGRSARRAVDGVVSGDKYADSVSETSGGTTQPDALTVDLLDDREVTGVVLYLRSDMCGGTTCASQMGALRVTLLDGSSVVCEPDAILVPTSFDWDSPIVHVDLSTCPVGASVDQVRVSTHDAGPQLSLAEIQVRALPLAPYSTNLALGRPIAQSSTYSNSLHSGFLNDGEIGDTFSFAHTGFGTNEYIEVDLTAPYFVDEVAAFNRTDCCGDRMNGLVLDLYDETRELLRTVASNDADAHRYPANVNIDAEQWRYRHLGQQDVRYVRVRRADGGVLNLNELQVWGRERQAGPAVTLANSNVSMSSLYQNIGTWTGAKALDGRAQTFSHTEYDANAWWEVDLGQVTAIQTILLSNRIGDVGTGRESGLGRLKNFHVDVLDGAHNPVWSAQHPGQAGRHVTVVPDGAEGRYVRVQLNGSNYLSLAGVQVFGVAPSTLLPGDAFFETVNVTQEFEWQNQAYALGLLQYSSDCPANVSPCARSQSMLNSALWVGDVLTFDVTLAGPLSSSAADKEVVVSIDYDHDGIFEENEQFAAFGSASSDTTFTFTTPPLNAPGSAAYATPSADTTMRIDLVSNGMTIDTIGVANTLPVYAAP